MCYNLTVIDGVVDVGVVVAGVVVVLVAVVVFCCFSYSLRMVMQCSEASKTMYTAIQTR